jgi:hypothetical protein
VRTIAEASVALRLSEVATSSPSSVSSPGTAPTSTRKEARCSVCAFTFLFARARTCAEVAITEASIAVQVTNSKGAP